MRTKTDFYTDEKILSDVSFSMLKSLSQLGENIVDFNLEMSQNEDMNKAFNAVSFEYINLTYSMLKAIILDAQQRTVFRIAQEN